MALFAAAKRLQRPRVSQLSLHLTTSGQLGHPLPAPLA